jgi:superfamily II DNA helicase RecQ
MLPTSSGKSALFFSVAAMTIQQIVIVVVPFTALVDDIVIRGQVARGWIVATGALGTGINIEGIVYIVHVDRPYRLTSFIQQSGRNSRNGEVSDSIIIARV